MATKPQGLDFNETLARLEKLSGACGYPSLTMAPTKKGLTLSATNRGSTIEVGLNHPIEGLTSPWNFNWTTLSAMIAKRKGVQLSMEESTLSMTAKGFKVTMTGSEASTVPKVVAPEAAGTKIQLDADVRLVLIEALKAVSLQKPLAALPDIVVNVQFTAKRVTAIAFDKSQMASYSTANTTKQVFEVTLPINTLESLVKGTLGEAEVICNEGVLYAKSGPYKMSMMLPPEEELLPVPIDRVKSRVAELRKMSLANSVEFSKQEVLDFMSNAKVLSKSTSSLNIASEGQGKATISIKGEGSQVQATIKAKSTKKFSVYLDIYYLQAILDKCKEDVLALSFDDSLFIMKDSTLVYSAVLSSPPEKASAKTKKAKKEEEDEELEE